MELSRSAEGNIIGTAFRIPSGRLGFPCDSVVKNLPAMQELQEMWVQSLGHKISALEEGMATHTSILAWRIPWKEEPGGLQSIESQRIRHD